jgi:hypothetical protein
MKKYLLSTFAIIFFSLSVSAQVTLTLSPDNVVTDVDPMQFETVAHSILTNTSDSTKTFRWYRTEETITMGWASAICDKNACYATTVDSTTTDFDLILGPGDSTNLDVHIRPGGIEGNAKVKVTIVEVGNPENTIEGIYTFNQTSSSFDVVSENLRIYPNPASSYFQLSNADNIASVSIYSLVGRHLKKYHAFPGEKFYIGDLDRGMYLVRMENKQNEVIKTLRLSKR